jgi:hypothetical protein
MAEQSGQAGRRLCELGRKLTPTSPAALGLMITKGMPGPRLPSGVAWWANDWQCVTDLSAWPPPHNVQLA